MTNVGWPVENSRASLRGRAAVFVASLSGFYYLRASLMVIATFGGTTS